MMFLNFKRDYSCTQAQFQQMFRSNFDMDQAALQDYQIDILMQRYAVSIVDQPSQTKSTQESTASQRVFYFRMFYQLACRNLGYHFDDQKNLKIAETLMKAMKLREVEVQMEQVLNLDLLLNSQEYSERGSGLITAEQFCRACRGIGIDEKTCTTAELVQFLRCLAPAELTPPSNAGRSGGLGDTMLRPDGSQEHLQSHNIQKVVARYRQYLVKSPAQIYQDILNEIFVASKQRGLSQSVLTLFTEIDELDGEKDGHVSIQQFEDAIKNIIGGASTILPIDARYLALKYLTTKRRPTAEERTRVFYHLFYNDYRDLEERGVYSEIDGLEMSAQPKPGAEETKNPFDYKVPQKFLDFYEELRRWLENRSKVVNFCAMLVETDEKREGFLSNQ